MLMIPKNKAELAAQDKKMVTCPKSRSNFNIRIRKRRQVKGTSTSKPTITFQDTPNGCWTANRDYKTKLSAGFLAAIIIMATA